MNKLDPSLKNQRFKQFLINRIFPNGDEVGCHKFKMGSVRCSQCSQLFWDWIFQNDDGSVGHKMKLCSVIGRDEIERFSL